MYKKFALVMAVFCVLAFAAPASADLLPGFQYIISYDGYLHKHTGLIQSTYADTLIVVTNAHPSQPLTIHMDVFDKYGTLVWDGNMLDGGDTAISAPANGYLWQTLGNVVARDTQDPWGYDNYGEKFHFRISAKHTAGTLRIVPIVEVKQIVYHQEIDGPNEAEAVWIPTNFDTWTETSLGGNKYANGVIWAP
jgi:hypothetical protein